MGMVTTKWDMCILHIYIYIYVCVRYCAVVLQAENDGLRTSGDSLSPAYGGAFSSPPPSRWTAKPFWVFGLWMLPLSVSPAERKWHPHSQTNIEDDRSIEGKSPSKYLHIKQVMQRDAVMLWLKAIPSHMSCAFRFSIRFPPQDWTPRRGRRCLSFGVGEGQICLRSFFVLRLVVTPNPLWLDSNWESSKTFSY